MAILNEQIDDEDITWVMCPNCCSLVNALYARGINNQFGMILGYYLECDKCNEGHVINYGGHPPLFDLQTQKFYIAWDMPEV